MKLAISKIAKILRCPEEILLEIEEKAGKLTNQKEVFERIVEENEKIIKDRLKRLKISSNKEAGEIFKSLLRKIALDDQILLQQLGNISPQKIEDLKKLILKI